MRRVERKKKSSTESHRPRALSLGAGWRPIEEKKEKERRRGRAVPGEGEKKKEKGGAAHPFQIPLRCGRPEIGERGRKKGKGKESRKMGSRDPPLSRRAPTRQKKEKKEGGERKAQKEENTSQVKTSLAPGIAGGQRLPSTARQKKKKRKQRDPSPGGVKKMAWHVSPFCLLIALQQSGGESARGGGKKQRRNL